MPSDDDAQKIADEINKIGNDLRQSVTRTLPKSSSVTRTTERNSTNLFADSADGTLKAARGKLERVIKNIDQLFNTN